MRGLVFQAKSAYGSYYEIRDIETKSNLLRKGWMLRNQGELGRVAYQIAPSWSQKSIILMRFFIYDIVWDLWMPTIKANVFSKII